MTRRGSITAMVTGIRRGAKPHLYIEEHMEDRGLSDEQLAGRLGVARQTVFRWRKEQHRLDPGKIAAIAEAIGLSAPTDLYRTPERPSIDAIADQLDQVLYDALLEHARNLVRKAS